MTHGILPRVLLFPGQGSQHVGMGEELFGRYRVETEACSDLLGYCLRKACLEGPEEKLSDTLYTQPSLFVVNALAYMDYVERGGEAPAFAAGLSLGEYDALLAAGAFDLLTGLQVVHRRAQFMSAARSGGMIAVHGVERGDIERCLQEEGLTSLDLANVNTYTQLVLAGPAEGLAAARAAIRQHLHADAVLLPVGGAFHSRYMRQAGEAFGRFLGGVSFAPLKIPVVSNVTARPHRDADIPLRLVEQITSTVRWLDSVTYILEEIGDFEAVELGPGRVLSGLVKSIKRRWARRPAADQSAATRRPYPAPAPSGPEALGSPSFRARHGVDLSYVAGAMAHGISSVALVSRMAERRMLSFFGTGGLPVDEVDRALAELGKLRDRGLPFGANLLGSDQQDAVVDVLLRHEVRVVEASAFVDITPALIRYRLKGVQLDGAGAAIRNRVIAKVSRPDVAQRFMSPAPPRLVDALLAAGEISAAQAELARRIPVADDITLEGNSGGHTSPAASILELLPLFRALRDEMVAAYGYREPIHVGAGGGIGHPDAAAVAFMLGADYVLTGSVNQCTVEAGTSDTVKQMLAEADVFDTDFAPSADMFEIGAQVQVLKRGTLYPARARRLQELYRSYNDWSEIAEGIRRQLEASYLLGSFDEVLQGAMARCTPEQRGLVERVPKHRMALVFRWYCSNAARLARDGDPSRKIDFQVWTGPAMGAFNRSVRGSELEDWRSRHVEDVAQRMMAGAAEGLHRMASRALVPTAPVPLVAGMAGL